MVSHHPVTSDGHSYYGDGDMIYFLVEGQDSTCLA